MEGNFHTWVLFQFSHSVVSDSLWLYEPQHQASPSITNSQLLPLSHFRLCEPIVGSPPGSPVSGILQARTLEWVAISFSNTWKWKVKESCPTLSDLMDCSLLLEFTQTHVHWVGDAIQPSHPLLFPSPPALNLSQHQGLFDWVSSSHQVARYWSFSFKHQSFQWIFICNWILYYGCFTRLALADFTSSL